MIGVGRGIIPASRFLRRRAAAEDLGAADDVDAFWSAAPRLYDFSQQLQLQAPPRPPSPSPPPPPAAAPSPSLPTPEKEARDDPCLLLLQRSPSPPPAARSSPSPPRELEPLGACLLTLRRGCVGWGARRGVIHRHRAGDGDGSPPEAVVAVVERGHEESKARGSMKMMKEVGKEETAVAGTSVQQNKCAVVKAGENRRRVAKSSLRRRREEVSCQNGKHQVAKEEKTRNRKRERNGRDRDPAKKILPVKEENEEEGSSLNKKRKRPASSRVKREVNGTEEVRVYNRRRHDADKLAEKTPKDGDEEEESKPTTTALAPKLTRSPPRGKEDRWPARRYAAGEAVLLDILRARGASARNPAPRAELRAEARKRIGDTGLLDHLLLHAADKVPAGSAERIRRRHNVDGALVYFLEPAGLKALRKEAGVDDPFWVPPPGWKLGDPTSPDAVALAVKKQVEDLAAELAVVKRQMKKLGSNLVDLSKEAYISWKGYDCMLKANENLGKEFLSLEEKYDNVAQANGELKEELLLLKENYESMTEKNAKLEEQIVDISSCFQFLKDDLPLPETEDGEQQMLMLEPADHCVKEPSKADNVKQEALSGNAPGDVFLGANKATVGEGSISEKRTLRKCSMRICKLQGTFQWPDTSAGMATGEACSPKALSVPLTPGGDLILTNFDTVIFNLPPSSLEEYLATDGLPTPTSASSTTAASPRLPLLPTLSSPLQQLPIITDDDLQTVQPCSGGLDSHLPHKDLPSSSSAPCLLGAGKKVLVLGGSNVGTDLALVTSSY